jgi:hypothetical protein
MDFCTCIEDATPWWLIAYVEPGGILDCQDDIPGTLREELYMEEQQRLESSQTKSNKSLVPEAAHLSISTLWERSLLCSYRR